MKLNELPIGKTASITRVGGEGALRQHFLDMGVIPNADITLVKYAPMGDPMEFMIHGYELTLRVDDAKKIEIENVRSQTTDKVSLGQRKKAHIRDWVKVENITSRQMKSLCPTERY